MNLTERLTAIVRSRYPDYETEKRLVTFSVCPICGNADFRCAEAPGKEFRVAVDNSFGWTVEKCTVCLDVLRRAPEVFRWTLAVLSEKREDKS